MCVIDLLLLRLLKDKRLSDESFNKFLELKRGAAMHTLESLMLLPVSSCTNQQTKWSLFQCVCVCVCVCVCRFHTSYTVCGSLSVGTCQCVLPREEARERERERPYGTHN